MRIIKSYARMISSRGGSFLAEDGIRLLQHVEWCARISHRSEDAQTDESWRRLLASVVLQHGDWSVTEHAVVSVDAVVDRGITHEWVRHRIGAYTQESTRFVNYEKKIPPSFIYPIPEVQCSYCLAGDPIKWDEGEPSHQPAGFTVMTKCCMYNPLWLTGIESAEAAYKLLIAKGWRPQEARSVFPNALASRLITTYNLRNWRHFFLMRTSAEAHPQMREVTVPLLAEFKAKVPLLYDDIEPNGKQSENLKKAR